MLDRSRRAHRRTGVMPERVIREGDKVKELFDLVEEDEDIAILVLAAGTSNQGPGPLVASLANTADNYPVPIAIAGHLSDEELDTMSSSVATS